MMRVRVTKSHADTEDGFSMQWFEAGKEYDVTDPLGSRMCWTKNKAEMIKWDNPMSGEKL